jgi:Biopolymer transport proteins
MAWLRKRSTAAVVVAAAACMRSGLAVAAEDYIEVDFAASGWAPFFSELFRSVDMGGFILLVLMVILIGMCIDLVHHLRLSKLIPESLLGAVQEEMANGEYERALELCEKSDSLIGQVFAAGLQKTDYSFERMSEALRSELEIQGLVWRQWVKQFKVVSFTGPVLGCIVALLSAMRFVADLAGRPNIGLALSSSFEMRSLVYGFFLALLFGLVMAVFSLTAYNICSSRLEKILLEAGRLGEELLDPFRPLPLLSEE